MSFDVGLGFLFRELWAFGLFGCVAWWVGFSSNLRLEFVIWYTEGFGFDIFILNLGLGLSGFVFLGWVGMTPMLDLGWLYFWVQLL